MPKLNSGPGHKRGVISRPRASYTSPRAIKQRQRQATALDYRLQGHAYHAIAKHMNCDPSTVHDLVCKASARAIMRKKRMAEVLTYRLAGHSYAAIGRQMNIPPATAHGYAIKAIAAVVPIEDARQVLAQELLKLDAMATGVYENAIHGEPTAIDAMLSIMRLRGRYLGLFPDGKHPGVNINIGGPTAEAEGIQVHFVLPDRVKRLAEA